MGTSPLMTLAALLTVALAGPDVARAQAIPRSFASLLMNTGVADARAKAVQILDKFTTFDLEAAKRRK